MSPKYAYKSVDITYNHYTHAKVNIHPGDWEYKPDQGADADQGFKHGLPPGVDYTIDDTPDSSVRTSFIILKGMPTEKGTWQAVFDDNNMWGNPKTKFFLKVIVS